MSGVAFDVIEGGLLTTIQDAGRPDWQHLGVPESGAADPWSRAVANLLIGNDSGDAVLEMTVVGPTLRTTTATTIGLAGADLGARIRDGHRLRPDRSHRLAAGDIIEIPGSRSAAGGIRAYLAIEGGVDVPVVLGSRSTCLAGGFGGLDGRPIKTGDRIVSRGHRAGARRPTSPRPSELVWPVPDVPPGGSHAEPVGVLRFLAGPGAGAADVAAAAWVVGRAADRVGIRLDGPSLPAGVAGETTSHGVPWGAIQLPPDGRPIVLGADHQTTGGYRVCGVVISADLAVLGQLGPGSAVRLMEVDRATALAALREQRERLVAGAAAVRDAAGWDALLAGAGG